VALPGLAWVKVESNLPSPLIPGLVLASSPRNQALSRRQERENTIKNDVVFVSLAHLWERDQG